MRDIDRRTFLLGGTVIGPIGGIPSGVLSGAGVDGGPIGPAAPAGVPTIGGIPASPYANFAGSSYFYNNVTYGDFSSWLTALGGTFTRASTGTFVNSAGLVATANSNVARFTYDPATLAAQGILLEGSRTNLVLWNRDLTNAAWTPSNITAALNQVGADGAANSATSLTATAGNGTILQSITSASASRLQSSYVKRLTGSGTINMTMDNGVTWTAIVLTAAWTRVSIPNATVTNPIVGFRIVTSGDAIAVDFVQNETGASATSVMATTTTSVTRAADNLTLSTSPWYNPVASTVLATFINVLGPNPAGVMSLNNGANTNRIDIRAGSANSSVVSSGGVLQSNVSFSNTFSAGAAKAIVAVQAGDQAIDKNGGTVTTGTPATMPVSISSFQIGGIDGSVVNALQSAMSSIAYWPFRAPNADLTRLVQ